MVSPDWQSIPRKFLDAIMSDPRCANPVTGPRGSSGSYALPRPPERTDGLGQDPSSRSGGGIGIAPLIGARLADKAVRRNVFGNPDIAADH